MITAGASDQAVADRIGGISRMAVARHRHNHIELPAKVVVAATNKGKDVRDERGQLIAAAEAGDLTTAFLGIERIAADLRKVSERLERSAEAAESNRQPLVVASLSGQQLRSVEVRARLGEIGSYSPLRSSSSLEERAVVVRVERFLVDAPQIELEPENVTVIENKEEDKFNNKTAHKSS
jgi:hypothetical protein